MTAGEKNRIVSLSVAAAFVLLFSCFLKKKQPEKETAPVTTTTVTNTTTQQRVKDTVKISAPTMGVDTNEFAPGFPFIRMSALKQMRRFPLPRFKPGHKMMPDFLWMDPNYIGNSNIGMVTRKMVIQNSVDIQYELAKNWNFYLQVSPNTSVDHKQYGNPESIQAAWIKLANEHPELPVSIISFWIQMKNNRVLNKKMGDNCYMRDKDGKFVSEVRDNNGVIRRGKLLSPNVPLDSLAADGVTQRGYIEKLSRFLKRPINMINEEDEIFSIYPGEVFERDPSLVADREKLKINHWYPYQSEKVTNIQVSYRDSFMKLPQLKNTLYTVYAIDGHATYRFHYGIMRKANSMINGQYYATPDFYPRYPNNWEKWRGPWHGLLWVKEARRNELPLKDTLFSPFVAPGWDRNPVKNMCPGQWLGLMKILGMMGAEFYYIGFFNEQAPFPDPEGYIWQSVIPVYAQAVTSRYENIFRHGEFVNYPSFNIPAGDPRIVVMARKVKGKEIYAIAGTIQNSSNKKDDAPLSATAEIVLAGKSLKFEVRRQGSVYIYNAEDPAHPIFYQLDRWHEYMHPARWSEDMVFEAENTDKEDKNILVSTDLPEAPGDYSTFTSYLTFKGSERSLPAASYNFNPRDSGAVYFLGLTARSKAGSSGFRVLLDGKEIGQVDRVSSNQWKQYGFNVPLKDLGTSQHEISFIPMSASVELDRFSLNKR